MKMRALSIAAFLVAVSATGSASAEAERKEAPAAAPAAEPAPVTLTLGKGAPQSTVIFMHGLGGNPHHSKELIRELLTPAEGKPAVRVVAVWMRPQDGVHTMTDQLARARRAIDAEHGPVVLMGHSFGGKAAVKLAAEYPKDKVTSVVALAPSVNMLQSYWKRITGERTLPADTKVIEAKLDQVHGALTRNLAVARAHGDREDIKQAASSLSYAETMRDLIGHDEPGSETSVKRPMLVLHGTHDDAVSIHYARRFAEANKTAVELVELDGVDHLFDHPRVSTRAVARGMMRKPVQQFLAKQAAAPAQADGHGAEHRVEPKRETTKAAEGWSRPSIFGGGRTPFARR